MLKLERRDKNLFSPDSQILELAIRNINDLIHCIIFLLNIFDKYLISAVDELRKINNRMLEIGSDE